LKPEYVTDVQPRKWLYPERYISIPMLGSRSEAARFINVHIKNFERASDLARRAWEASCSGRIEETRKILEQLCSLRAKPWEGKSSRERWAHMAMQLPGDVGGGPHKKRIGAILSARYQGRILEAMCGFNSYLLPSPDREVIALDYCREALERYPYPERIRVAFDLDCLGQKGTLDFFGKVRFDAVMICFGYDYLKDPAATFGVLRKILAKEGKLALVENPLRGYPDIILRRFAPEEATKYLRRVGFKKVTVEDMGIRPYEEAQLGSFVLETTDSKDRFYLVEASSG